MIDAQRQRMFERRRKKKKRTMVEEQEGQKKIERKGRTNLFGETVFVFLRALKIGVFDGLFDTNGRGRGGETTQGSGNRGTIERDNRRYRCRRRRDGRGIAEARFGSFWRGSPRSNHLQSDLDRIVCCLGCIFIVRLCLDCA